MLVQPSPFGECWQHQQASNLPDIIINIMHRYDLCFIADGYLVLTETVEADSYNKAKAKLRRIYKRRKITSIRLN